MGRYRYQLLGKDAAQIIDSATGAAVDITSAAAAPGVVAQMNAKYGNGNYTSLHQGQIPTSEYLDSLAGPSAPGTNGDVFDDELYDSQAITTATAVNASFFTAASTSNFLSNQKVAGQLPNREKFLVYYIGIEYVRVDDGAVTTTFYKTEEIVPLFNSLYFELTVGTPIMASGTGTRFLNPNASVVVNTNNLAPLNPFRRWALRNPIPILANMTYKATITANATTLTGTLKYLRFILQGIHYRDR